MSDTNENCYYCYYLLLHVIKHGRKFAIFAPEDNPASEFCHDLVEIYLGCGASYGKGHY